MPERKPPIQMKTSELLRRLAKWKINWPAFAVGWGVGWLLFLLARRL